MCQMVHLKNVSKLKPNLLIQVAFQLNSNRSNTKTKTKINTSRHVVSAFRRLSPGFASSSQGERTRAAGSSSMRAPQTCPAAAISEWYFSTPVKHSKFTRNHKQDGKRDAQKQMLEESIIPSFVRRFLLFSCGISNPGSDVLAT